jgi:hypothetical protein
MNKYLILVDQEYTSVGIKDPEELEYDVYIDENLDVSLGIFEAKSLEEARKKASNWFGYPMIYTKGYKIYL